mgnify:CR=1 FL=1
MRELQHFEGQSLQHTEQSSNATLRLGARAARAVTLRVALGAAVLVALAAFGRAQADAPKAEETKTVEAAAPEPALLLDRGEGELPLPVPRGEELVFRARVRLGPVDTRVGTITLSSGVEPFRESLLFAAGDGARDKLTAWVRARAVGNHTFYSMDSTLESRFQPQVWPALVHTMVQKGTENRRREILVGERDGKSVRSYRSDTNKGAPSGTRIWRSARIDPCPPGAVDSIACVYLLRSMLEHKRETLEFPMLDKERLWWVRAELGKAQRISTHAGDFDARPVRLASTKLDPAKYKEQIDDLERPDAADPEFQGPFGIQGDIRLWVESNTGVPVWIEGDLPIGFVTLQLDIQLERFRGTPIGFRPLESK